MRRFGFLIRYIWIVGLVWLASITIAFTPKESRASETENRMLAGFPPFSVETVLDGSFMSGVETWLSDGIALREQWIQTSQRVEKVLAVPREVDEAAQFEAAIEAELGTGASEAATPEPTSVPDQQPETSAEASPTRETTIPNTAEATPVPTVQDTAFWVRYNDGRVRTLDTYPHKNVERAAQYLNAYRAILPEDGRVIFAEVPTSFTGTAYQEERDKREAWGSDMEDELQKIVDDGVYIINATAALLDPLERGEYVYFRTDAHWTALGAHYLYRAMMERLGIPAMAYNDYAYTVQTGMRGNASNNKKSDTVEIMGEILPTHSFVLKHLTESREVQYMYPDRASYLAFIGGTLKPWRRFTSGSQTGRTALLISDSFGNALLPYLLPHYDSILMTDLRPGNYEPKEAGATIREYIEYYGVDDVYFTFCFASDINSDHFKAGFLVQHLQ